MTNVDGLSSLISVDEDLYFADNPALCQTLVNAIVDGLEPLGWSGSVGAYRNADC